MKSAGVDLALTVAIRETQWIFSPIVSSCATKRPRSILASGDRVELIVSANGGVAEQARWALRCDRFAACTIGGWRG
jgi:hypothetical protein